MNEQKNEKQMTPVDCPYCGQVQMIEIEDRLSPTEYRALAAMNCSCPGSWIVRQKERIREKIKNDDLDDDAADSVLEMVKMMRNGEFDKITIKKNKMTYTLSVNAENVLKFKRQESRKEEMTL